MPLLVVDCDVAERLLEDPSQSAVPTIAATRVNTTTASGIATRLFTFSSFVGL
jgi:hypothetical protein